jgi:hypothetical protein
MTVLRQATAKSRLTGVDPRATGATAHLGRVGVEPVTCLPLPPIGWSLANADYATERRSKSA